MKKYNNYIVKLAAAKKELKDLEDNRSKFNEELCVILDGLKLSYIKKNPDDEKVKEYKRIKKNIQSLDCTIQHLELVIKVMKHNAKLKLAECIIPHVINDLEPYEGKAIGERTRENIREHFKKEYNVLLSFIYDSEYSNTRCHTIDINPLPYNYNDCITLSTGYDNDILPGNKLDLDTLKTITVQKPHGEFIKNPDKHVDKIMKEHTKLYEMQNVLTERIKKYNAMCVEGITTCEYVSAVKPWL